YAGGGEGLEVVERLRRPLAREAIEAPEQHDVEPAAPRVPEHPVEGGAVGAPLLPAGPVLVHLGHLPASPLGVVTELAALVRRRLGGPAVRPHVVLRDAEVEGAAGHGTMSWLGAHTRLKSS